MWVAAAASACTVSCWFATSSCFNSSSSPYTLKIMTVVAFIFVPIVIAYKIWVYRVFRAPVTEAEVLGDKHAY